jgi:hypothetical protein
LYTGIPSYPKPRITLPAWFASAKRLSFETSYPSLVYYYCYPSAPNFLVDPYVAILYEDS